jgi:hypothetical protein
MVDRDRSLSTLQRCAARHAAMVFVPLQNFLTMTAVIFLVLALQRLARRAQLFRKNQIKRTLLMLTSDPRVMGFLGRVPTRKNADERIALRFTRQLGNSQ